MMKHVEMYVYNKFKIADKKAMEADCIKLFNAIDSLCYVLHSLFGKDYRQ